MEFLKNKYFVAMIGSTKSIHRLANEGKDNTPEFQAEQDRSDDYYEHVNTREASFLQWFSEDLYNLQDVKATPYPLTGHILTVKEELQAAWLGLDWIKVLEKLREVAVHVPFAKLMFAKGLAWSNMGDYETAELFFNKASELGLKTAVSLDELLAEIK
jgi:hypothetical protein